MLVEFAKNPEMSGAPNLHPSTMADDLWAIRNWSQHFSRRTSLADELALLERLFPLAWRLESLREPESKHQIRGDLLTIGGRGRLLALAAELLQVDRCEKSVQGRLRCWSLYEPTKSELLVGPILRLIGDVTWQPEGSGHGADYRLDCSSNVYVAEVKRLCTSKREEAVTMKRVLADMGRSGPIFTPEEQVENRRRHARRLYPRVRQAARQLAQSATNVAKRRRATGARVPGILFLDLDGNRELVNIRERICGWMNLRWAHSVDLILFYDYGCRENVWGTIAEPIYSRTGTALEALSQELPICSRLHFHVGNLPVGLCDFPLPL